MRWCSAVVVEVEMEVGSREGAERLRVMEGRRTMG